MSISADDSGSPAHPDDELADAINGFFHHRATNSGVPPTYLRALRHGAPGSRHRITIKGRPVSIVLGHQLQRPEDPAREKQSWIKLREAVALLRSGHDCTHLALPREVAGVVINVDGRQVRVLRPAPLKGRLRRRLTALSPLPLLGALTQPIAGSATAVGIAVAPIAPPIHPAPPPVVREMTGDIARPELPYTPGTTGPGAYPTTPAFTVPTLPTLPAPADAAAADTNVPPQPDPAPAVTPTLSASPQPSSTPSIEPSPVVTSKLDAGEPTGLATPRVTDKLTAEPSPPRRLLQPRHRHHRHHPGHRKHLLDGLLRHHR